jgi:hypothetical protein
MEEGQGEGEVGVGLALAVAVAVEVEVEVEVLSFAFVREALAWGSAHAARRTRSAAGYCLNIERRRTKAPIRREPRIDLVLPRDGRPAWSIATPLSLALVHLAVATA